MESQRQKYLHFMVEHGDRNFDPAAGLLWMSKDTYRNIHTEHLAATPRHPVRESLYYALVLLELAERSLQGRAETIIGRVIDLQEINDPDLRTHGLWPYFLEESVAEWRCPDFNWADFNGMTLLLIRHRHRRRLSAALVARIDSAVARAAVCIRRRNVDLHYTNIAIKGTFVTLSIAEVAGDAELFAYAINRMERLHEAVEFAGGFGEYNSPTYAAVSLAGLHAMETYVRDERARAWAASLSRRLWRDVAERFHPETRELAGPHARAYSISLHDGAELPGSLIEKASQGAVSYSTATGREPFGALYSCVVNVEAPADVVAALSATASKPRQVVRTHEREGEAPRVQTTWLEPAFCLGSVSFQDGWEQRQNLIAYWKSKDGKTGHARHRYLRDDRPCCSGYFVSRQREGAVVAGSFLGAYADHHVSLPTTGALCAFLGTVLEVDAAGEAMGVRVGNAEMEAGDSLTLDVGMVISIRLKAVKMEFSLMSHEVAPASKAKPRVERVSADRLRIVLPHYEGRRKKIRWLDFERATSTYALRMAAGGGKLPSAVGLEIAMPQRMPPSQAAAEAWGTERAPVTACPEAAGAPTG